jgi:signal transduction histidine kinase
MGDLRLSEDELFSKYEGGRIPPLVAAPDSRLGLVNEKLLEIYQRGFSLVHSVPLGMLLPNQAFPPGDPRRWTEGNYRLNQSCIPDWTNLCSLIRKFRTPSGKQPGDKKCEDCDRRMAYVAEKAGRAIAYLCCHGMIDVVVPVRMDSQTVAVLLSGQLRPREGCEWPKGLVQVDDPEEFAKAASLDLWSLSNERVEQLAAYGIDRAEIERARGLDDIHRPTTRVTPEEVETLLKRMDSASVHLSTLAANTYDFEKARLVSLIRFGLAHPLTILKKDMSNWAEALRAMEPYLHRFATLYGMHYVALCRVLNGSEVEVVCQTGLDGILAGSNGVSIKLTGTPHYGRVQRFPGLWEVDLNCYSEIPVVAQFLANAQKKGLDASKVLCAIRTDEFGFLLAVGSLRSGVLSMSESDAKSLGEIATVASLIGETLYLLRDLHQAESDIGRLLEDVAHDLRSPIQTIVNKAARFKSGRLTPVESVEQARKLAAACMRINLLAHRVWTAQRLWRGKLEYKDSPVSVRETVKKAIDALSDISAREGVDVLAEWDELEQVHSVVVDSDMLFQSILNILHNAIKYSTPSSGERRPQVIIRGRFEGGYWMVSVGNRGILLKKEDIPRIFERYVRTEEAIRWKPEGAGIGLSIVKDFVAHYRGEVKVTCDPIPGTTDYKTIFEICLPMERRR